MKTRPLPETDLANIAALPRERRRKRLEAISLTWTGYSYQPSRNCESDSMNQQLPLMGPQPSSTWEQIELKLRRLAKSEQELEANIGVSKPLHKFVTDEKISGRPLNIAAMAIGLGFSIRFWSSTGLVTSSGLVVPFMDYRRTGLTPEGRRIAFSLMKEHIELRYPDYGDARLGICQFTDAKNRQLVIRYADGVPLFDYEELESRIAETYALWFDVLEDKTETLRRAGGAGPLL